MFRAITDGALGREIQSLTRTGCRTDSIIAAHDGFATRCAGEPEIRVATDDESDAAALPRALRRLLHVRSTLARWRRDPALVGAWPSSLCNADRLRVVADGEVLYATSEHCVLAIDAAREVVRAVAMEGECAQVPVAPWSAALRTVGRFDEVRGANGTYCRFTLGWNGRTSRVIAVGDEGTRSAPIARAPTVAVDPRAVNTAVAFLHDLLRYATGESPETPANVRPAVLRTLGADQPGTPAHVAVCGCFNRAVR